ncbi:type II toxin-antitoxin system PemK/MazF family toxin [Lactobacillus sp. ESL0679]|uniref:type II toxin-antitoxin system PemK/MazF family toxin n=1 Tax=Lactobacillus sp. ESL0679 TaxID=2983209 RepID=UPI0023F7B091|nr:type II toxin-antitoxin system PemK/MazF family toxin [Lactobacillus sp. ESL0679]MDF7683797.1 type II toxin-antitoxin system PemK/MazF family toxin [Lactobacillus sp. ESL0679]
MKLHQGDIIWLDLEPAKGTETKKRRPCLVVSNDDYNRIFNTVMTVPISMAKKYFTEEKYKKSPFFVPIDQEKIHGTALLQQARTVDPTKRTTSKVKGKLPALKMQQISNVLAQFY